MRRPYVVQGVHYVNDVPGDPCAAAIITALHDEDTLADDRGIQIVSLVVFYPTDFIQVRCRHSQHPAPGTWHQPGEC